MCSTFVRSGGTRLWFEVELIRRDVKQPVDGRVAHIECAPRLNMSRLAEYACRSPCAPRAWPKKRSLSNPHRLHIGLRREGFETPRLRARCYWGTHLSLRSLIMAELRMASIRRREAQSMRPNIHESICAKPRAKDIQDCKSGTDARGVWVGEAHRAVGRVTRAH